MVATQRMKAKMIQIIPALCSDMRYYSNSLAVHSFCHQRLPAFRTMLLLLNKVSFGFAPITWVTVLQDGNSPVSTQSMSVFLIACG